MFVEVTHICVNKLTIIDSDNDLSPCRRQAIIWTKAGILLIGHYQDWYIFIHENAFKNVVWNMTAIFFSASMC